MELRQLAAAVSRSAGLISNRTSFSASANVEAETGGPTSGAVPKAGGVPGGRDVDEAFVEIACGLRHAAKAAMRRPDARLKNPRRVFDMFHIVAVV
jgi:hypothetical protein